MSEQPDTLQFRLPSHADAVLSRMNTLREEQHFCDVTLLLLGPLGAAAAAAAAAAHSFCFHGHKVVLAAASDFLRDQFLLHSGQAELTVSAVTNVEVGKRLLLSCYTGLLEVPRCELVTYLTAASALQMNLVVDKCVQALSVYFRPTLVSTSKEEETKQTKTSEIQVDTAFGQKVDIDSKQEIVGEQDYVNTGYSLTMLEYEANKIPNASVKNANCTTPEERKHPVDKGVLVDHLHQEDGKIELNNKIEEPVMEAEISISLDMPKKHTVEYEDATGSVAPKSYQSQNYNQVFEKTDNYAKHVKDHQIYQCLVCEKSFSQKSDLSLHLRVHTQVKPYRCPLCHSTFPNKASLQYHVNLHVGNYPLQCNYCTAQNEQGLRRHLKDIHGHSTMENAPIEG